MLKNNWDFKDVQAIKWVIVKIIRVRGRGRWLIR